MKVRELIKELLDYNMDAEVSNRHYETGESGYVCGKIDGNDEFGKENTPIVFINGCDLINEDN